MKGEKPKNNTTAPSADNNNYFAPLQTIDDDDSENGQIRSETKAYIPPITILKCKPEEIHEICKVAKIKDYSIRKISIGIKLFCNSKSEFDSLCTVLNGKYEFFTYATKDEKPYKALLFGLETLDPSLLKKKLIALGLQCLDVKIVNKTTKYATFVIYVVYFKRKTTTMKELRLNHSVIDHVKVKWDFQMSRKNRITQCHNCQMYGHGSSHCKVKTFCANCAGNHNSTDCKENAIKCANCKGPHKSTDENCPSKTHYLNVKQRNRPINKQQNKYVSSGVNYNNNFPNSLRQNIPRISGVWQHPMNHNNNNNSNYNNTNFASNTTSNSGELFSAQELQALALELINNLRNCKSKYDQFEAISCLACKFLP